MRKSDADRLDFWIKEEYDKFIVTVEKDSKYYVIFEILFWACVMSYIFPLVIRIHIAFPFSFVAA